MWWIHNSCTLKYCKHCFLYILLSQCLLENILMLMTLIWFPKLINRALGGLKSKSFRCRCGFRAWMGVWLSVFFFISFCFHSSKSPSQSSLSEKLSWSLFGSWISFSSSESSDQSVPIEYSVGQSFPVGVHIAQYLGYWISEDWVAEHWETDVLLTGQIYGLALWLLLPLP